MHQQRSHDRSAERGLAEEEDRIQVAILSLLLALHPVQLTLSELTREMADDPEEFAERDQIRQAARDLTGAGLLHRHGPFLIPTRAALHFDGLLASGERPCEVMR